MSKLSPDARDLVDAARAAQVPPREARSRVRAGVIARVGAGVAAGSVAAVGGAGSAVAKTAVGSGIFASFATGMGLAGVVVAAVIASGAASPSQGTAPPSVIPGVVAVAPRPTPAAAAGDARSPEIPIAPAASEAPAPATPIAVSAAPPSPRASSSAPSSLEAETALLAEAQADLRAGHPDRALAALDGREGAIDHAVLGEERSAVRVLALCAAGRTADAKAEAARFLAASPRSPMAARVRSSCAGSAPSDDAR